MPRILLSENKIAPSCQPVITVRPNGSRHQAATSSSVYPEAFSFDFCQWCYCRTDVVASSTGSRLVEGYTDSVVMNAAHHDYSDAARAFECCECKCKLTGEDN